MIKIILILAIVVSIQSHSATDSKIESDASKLNRKFAAEMKVVEQFAKDSRKMHKDLLKQPNLTKADKENIKKMELENLKLLKQTEDIIKKIEAD
jgi:hypothetical protein